PSLAKSAVDQPSKISPLPNQAPIAPPTSTPSRTRNGSGQRQGLQVRGGRSVTVALIASKHHHDTGTLRHNGRWAGGVQLRLAPVSTERLTRAGPRSGALGRENLATLAARGQPCHNMAVQRSAECTHHESHFRTEDGDHVRVDQVADSVRVRCRLDERC